MTATDSAHYRTLDRTIREVFPDVAVAPGLMVAATDSRNYLGVTDAVFRFSPVRAPAADPPRDPPHPPERPPPPRTAAHPPRGGAAREPRHRGEQDGRVDERVEEQAHRQHEAERARGGRDE